MAEDGAQGEAVDWAITSMRSLKTWTGTAHRGRGDRGRPIARGGADILDPDTASTGLLRTALTEAREDPDVAAVILRVDSPGGSMWRPTDPPRGHPPGTAAVR